MSAKRLPTDATRALDALRRIVAALRKSHARSRRAHGLSTAAVFVLREISHAPGLSLSELADRTGTSQSSVSEVVSRLVDEGYAKRTISTEDARRAELELLAPARAVIATSPATVQEELLRAFRKLSPRDQRSLADSLDLWVLLAGLGDVPARMFFERRRKSSANANREKHRPMV